MHEATTQTEETIQAFFSGKALFYRHHWTGERMVQAPTHDPCRPYDVQTVSEMAWRIERYKKLLKNAK